jgi:DNA-binding transcriptional LysR family regulator
MDHVAFDNVAGMANGVDLRRLRYFVAVAEECHFGRAAARLHMSTPPLSQRIRELESELGLTLFARTSRRVELTPAGERLLGEARLVLRAADAFDRMASELAAQLASHASPELADIGLGFCHGSEGGAMIALRRMLDQQPEVGVRPAAMTSLHIFEALRNGRISVGIVRGQVLRLSLTHHEHVPTQIPPTPCIIVASVFDAGERTDSGEDRFSYRIGHESVSLMRSGT